MIDIFVVGELISLGVLGGTESWVVDKEKLSSTNVQHPAAIFTRL